jgi:hypothetical protein
VTPIKSFNTLETIAGRYFRKRRIASLKIGWMMLKATPIMETFPVSRDRSAGDRLLREFILIAPEAL